MQLSRRHLLTLGGTALAGASVAPAVARAQTPKRGRTLAIRTWDPPHFDPFQTISYKTHNPVLVDIMQLVQKDLKTVGIDVKIDQKEYGAYIATCFYGKFDSMTFGPQTGFLEPDNFLFGQYYPEELKNQSHINDPVVADMLVRQRRTLDPAKRREIIYDIQRHLARQQYYVQMPSTIYVAVWEGAVKNYAPNMGYDYGGRLMAAWLER
jgi:ABC-type transport system substrate-binding protein